MSENLHTFCAWAARLRSWCELPDGPEAMSLTHDGVTLHVTARKATIVTPAGAGELDIDAQRWMTTPESVAMVPSSSFEPSPDGKQRPQEAE